MVRLEIMVEKLSKTSAGIVKGNEFFSRKNQI